LGEERKKEKLSFNLQRGSSLEKAGLISLWSSPFLGGYGAFLREVHLIRGRGRRRKGGIFRGGEEIQTKAEFPAICREISIGGDSSERESSSAVGVIIRGRPLFRRDNTISWCQGGKGSYLRYKSVSRGEEGPLSLLRRKGEIFACGEGGGFWGEKQDEIPKG